MSYEIIALFVVLGVVAAAFIAVWSRELSSRGQWAWPTPYLLSVGFVTDFLDALGIGSFATTTTLYRLRRAVADEKIPGTLNVGHCLPTIAQAYIYTSIIAVDPRTLVSLIAASVVGSWLGAGVVTRLPRRGIQLGMGAALLVAAGFIVAKLAQPEAPPAEAAETSAATASADATAAGVQTSQDSDDKDDPKVGLSGAKWAIALVGNFVFGALMTIGIGAYAPIMVMVSLLGMNETTAFPIMMGSCAFLMPTCGYRFIKSGAYDARAALGLAIAGVPGVLVAAFIVEKLELNTVRWLVLFVVIYTAVSLLIAAKRERNAGASRGSSPGNGENPRA